MHVVFRPVLTGRLFLIQVPTVIVGIEMSASHFNVEKRKHWIEASEAQVIA